MRRIHENIAAKTKAYRERNYDKVLERERAWDNENREKRNAISKAWRERNKEKYAEIRKASRVKHSATDRIYRERNKEQIYERTKKWAKNNPEKRSATHKAYKKRHPEKVIESTAIRRARINKGLIVKFTASELKQRLSVFGNKCWICGGVANQVDHVIPLAKGGPHVLSNLRPACGTCNRKKGAKSFKEVIN